MLRMILILVAILAASCMTADESACNEKVIHDTLYVHDTLVFIEAKGDVGALPGVWRGTYRGVYRTDPTDIAIIVSIIPAQDKTDSTYCICFARFSVTQIMPGELPVKQEGKFEYSSNGIIHANWANGVEFNLSYSLSGNELQLQQVGRGFLYAETAVKLER